MAGTTGGAAPPAQGVQPGRRRPRPPRHGDDDGAERGPGNVPGAWAVCLSHELLSACVCARRPAAPVPTGPFQAASQAPGQRLPGQAGRLCRSRGVARAWGSPRGWGHLPAGGPSRGTGASPAPSAIRHRRGPRAHPHAPAAWSHPTIKTGSHPRAHVASGVTQSSSRPEQTTARGGHIPGALSTPGGSTWRCRVAQERQAGSHTGPQHRPAPGALARLTPTPCGPSGFGAAPRTPSPCWPERPLNTTPSMTCAPQAPGSGWAPVPGPATLALGPSHLLWLL